MSTSHSIHGSVHLSVYILVCTEPKPVYSSRQSGTHCTLYISTVIQNIAGRGQTLSSPTTHYISALQKLCLTNVVHKYMQIFIQVSSLENQMGCCNYTLHLVGCLALNKPQATTTTVESHKRHKNSFLRSLISPCLDTNIMACRVVHCL